jgi:hypothetical protein
MLYFPGLNSSDQFFSLKINPSWNTTQKFLFYGRNKLKRSEKRLRYLHPPFWLLVALLSTHNTLAHKIYCWFPIVVSGRSSGRLRQQRRKKKLFSSPAESRKLLMEQRVKRKLWLFVVKSKIVLQPIKKWHGSVALENEPM